jgi:hypothetical protein
MLVDHLPGVVVVALMDNRSSSTMTTEQPAGCSAFPPAIADATSAWSRHGKPLTVAERRVDGETALLHVGQQMGK